MEKGLIITGKPLSGKTLVAEKIAETYKDCEVVILQTRDINFKNKLSLGRYIQPSTKVIIFEDIPKSMEIYFFYKFLDYFIVHVPYRNSFVHKIEQLILIYKDATPLDFPLDASFMRRFEIVNL